MLHLVGMLSSYLDEWSARTSPYVGGLGAGAGMG